MSIPCWGRPGSSALSKPICSSISPRGGYRQTSSADSHTPSRLLNPPPQESHGWPSLCINIWLLFTGGPQHFGCCLLLFRLYLLTGLTALADTGRAGTVCILPSTENPTQCPTVWLVSVCRMKLLSGQIAKSFIFTGVRGKGRKGVKMGGKRDLLKQTKCKDPMGNWAGNGLLCTALQSLPGLETCWGQPAPGNRTWADHQTHRDTAEVTLPHSRGRMVRSRE